MNDNKYEEAAEEFEKIPGFKDASTLLQKSKDTIAKRKRNGTILELTVGTILYSIIALPIGVVVGAVIGLIAGLVLYFTSGDPGLIIIRNGAIVGGVIGVFIAFLICVIDR